MPVTRVRRGVTLVELLVVLGIGGLIATAAGTLLLRQQRFFAASAAVVEQRLHLRDASTILPAELRALAPAGGDVIAFADSAIEVRATIGAGIVCDTVPGGLSIDLAAERAAAGLALTTFASGPEPGDAVLIYDEGAPDTAADDGWVERTISGITSPATACIASPLAVARDAGAPRLRLSLGDAPPIPGTIGAGAFVRVLRRVRYRHYRSATGDWYLGHAMMTGGAFGTVQPVSGPFAPYASGGQGGITLRYFDADGGEIAIGGDARRIARVIVTARGRPRRSIGAASGAIVDTLSLAVAVRNR